jgi:hypothetical protein
LIFRYSPGYNFNTKKDIYNNLIYDFRTIRDFLIRALKYIILRSADFIGFHKAEAIIKDIEVTIIDDISSGYLENIKHLNEICFIEKQIREHHY